MAKVDRTKTASAYERVCRPAEARAMGISARRVTTIRSGNVGGQMWTRRRSDVAASTIRCGSVDGQMWKRRQSDVRGEPPSPHPVTLAKCRGFCGTRQRALLGLLSSSFSRAEEVLQRTVGSSVVGSHGPPIDLRLLVASSLRLTKRRLFIKPLCRQAQGPAPAWRSAVGVDRS